MKLIDTHCHVFPDFLAGKAIDKLSKGSSYIPQTNGTLKDTLRIQHSWGCNCFVMLNIATAPEYVPNVNDFLLEHNDNKHIISFGSIHPQYADYKNELDRLERAGIKGIKFHPGYQNFIMDDKQLYPIYEEIAKRNMIMLFHAGYDPCFEGADFADPFRAEKVVRDFQGADIILAHMGNYLSNREAMRHLIGLDVYFDVSVASVYMPKAEIEQMIKAHGVDKFLYATDCPWSNGIETQKLIRSLNLLEADKDKIFYKNAAKLLNIPEGDIES